MTTTAEPEYDGLTPKAIDLLRRRGVTPGQAVAEPDHVVDAVNLRLENLGAAIGDRIGTRFVFAETDHPDALAWVRGFLSEPTTVGNLMLLGPTGVGKTHLVAGIIRRIAAERARDIARPLHWRAASHPQFNADMRIFTNDHHVAVLEACQQTGLLFLDDLAAGLARDWTDDNLYRLADVRWSKQRPTITASNLVPAELRTVLGQRVWERLIDEATVITLSGPSRRARKDVQR